MTLVFEKSKTRQSARLVLLALADNASDEGMCYPSIATIARKAGITQQVAREYLHALKEIGVIKIIARKDGERQTSNLYQFNEARIGNDEITPEFMKKFRPPSRVRPLLQSNTLPPVTELDPPPLTRVRDEPSVNHQKEPLREPHPRERTPLEIELKSLEDLFCKLSGLPAPAPNTAKEKLAAAQRWYQPMRRMQKLCNGTTGAIIEKAIKRMRSDRLTIAAPQSIESVVMSIHGERATTIKKPEGKIYE